MNFFSRTFDSKYINIFPVGDLHYGSPQCENRYVRHVVSLIKADQKGYWVGMGDLMENAIIGSKSDVYTQTRTPKEQIADLTKMFMPIKDKCLFMIGGNHEQRTMRVAGIAPDELIASNLDVPYMGFSCYAYLFMNSKTPNGFKCYFHHRPRRKSDPRPLRDIAPTADAIFVGHHHETARKPVIWFDVSDKNILRKVGYNYQIGSTISWNESYAEEKAFAPASVELLRVTLAGSTCGKYDSRVQTYTPILWDGRS
jgi:hypothetical protein